MAEAALPAAAKAIRPKLGRDESSVERLRREAGLAMRLEHPNALKILRLGETEDGLIYLVMPYLRGELLSDREVAIGPMDIMTGVQILVECCAGLHHAHDLNIVHRDLKPENIFVLPSGHVKVLDFGLAKLTELSLVNPGSGEELGGLRGVTHFMQRTALEGSKALLDVITGSAGDES